MNFFTAREITIIAITVALTVVFGWFFYLTANLLPIPGSRFVGVTVFSSFMIYFPVYKIRRRGVFLGVAAVFAGIMSLISLFMGLAIVLAGLLTEFAGWLVIKDYQSWRLIAVTGFFGFSGTLVSLLISFFIIGGAAFEAREILVPLILLTLLAFLGGCLGAYLADHIISRYLKQVKFWNQ